LELLRTPIAHTTSDDCDLDSRKSRTLTIFACAARFECRTPVAMPTAQSPNPESRLTRHHHTRHSVAAFFRV